VAHRQLIGLDGCRHGKWVAARLGPIFEIVEDLRPLLAGAAAGSVRLVIDVPIGLIANGRKCDAEARALLRQRRSSVFTPPSRAALSARTRLEASRVNFAVCGKKIGCQTFGILPRFQEVDQLVAPELQRYVHEGHPEVSFAVVSGMPMRFRKDTKEGEAERRAVLAAAGLRFDPQEVRQGLGCGITARDDIVDAAIMLVTAMRVEEGAAHRLPEDVRERDARGLLAEMWA
jgi:predicted RNase H-like nuclease